MKTLIKKIIYAFLVVYGVFSIVFLLFRSFGDPARQLTGQTGDRQTIENIRKDLNLDKPLWKQYLLFLNDLSPVAVHHRETIRNKKLRGYFIGGDYRVGIKWPYLGRSYQTRQPVTDMIVQSIPGTLLLAFAAMLIASVAGISLGVVSALYKGRWIDRISVIGSVAGISAPSFFMALLIGYLFGIYWHDYTGLDFSGSLFDVDEQTGESRLVLRNLLLPAFTLGIRPMALIAQLTRSSMLDVLSQDYIRTARAKGLRPGTVIWRHALPNSLNPVITAVTGWLAELLAGAFFVEYIFGWNGLGRVTVHALEKLDYPVVMGALLTSALIFVLVSQLSDMLYRKLDPRIGL